VDMPSFDELRKMAENNPEQLEQLRQQMVEEAINNAPESYQRRLRGLQFQVDMERRRAKNPMDSCIRISKMMHDHLYQMRETINGAQLESVFTSPVQTESVARDVESANEPRAAVLQFPGFASS